MQFLEFKDPQKAIYENLRDRASKEKSLKEMTQGTPTLNIFLLWTELLLPEFHMLTPQTSK